MLGWDARSRITDLEQRMISSVGDANVHASARRRELHTVVEQNEHQLTDERAIADDRRFVEVGDGELHSFAFRERMRRVRRIERDVVEKQRLTIQRQFAGVRAREKQEVLYEPAQPLALSLDPLQRVYVLRFRAPLLQRDLRAAADHG